MDKAPLVSVIMTAYNTDLYVKKSIESVLKQSYTNLELLVADDNSNDKTKQIIDKFTDSRIRRFHNSQNLHLLRTRNNLFKKAQGDYIAFLDSDDLYAYNKLELQLKEFKKDPELAMCGCNGVYIDQNDSIMSEVNRKPISYKEIKHFYKNANPFIGSAIMIKTAVLKEFNGYRDFFFRYRK